MLGNNRSKAVTSNQIEIMEIGAKESALDGVTKNVVESLLDIPQEGTQHSGTKSRRGIGEPESSKPS